MLLQVNGRQNLPVLWQTPYTEGSGAARADEGAWGEPVGASHAFEMVWLLQPVWWSKWKKLGKWIE